MRSLEGHIEPVPPRVQKEANQSVLCKGEQLVGPFRDIAVCRYRNPASKSSEGRGPNFIFSSCCRERRLVKKVEALISKRGIEKAHKALRDVRVQSYLGSLHAALASPLWNTPCSKRIASSTSGVGTPYQYATVSSFLPSAIHAS